MGMMDEGRQRRAPMETDDLLLGQLSEEEKDEIRARARRTVLAEQKKKLEEEFYQLALKEQRHAVVPDEELVQVVIDMPGFANWILLDNTVYHHGAVYNVTRTRFATIAECMARAWAHEEEVGEPNRRFYQKPAFLGTSNFLSRPVPSRDIRISPENMDVPSSQLLKAGVIGV